MFRFPPSRRPPDFDNRIVSLPVRDKEAGHASSTKTKTRTVCTGVARGLLAFALPGSVDFASGRPSQSDVVSPLVDKPHEWCPAPPDLYLIFC